MLLLIIEKENNTMARTKKATYSTEENITKKELEIEECKDKLKQLKSELEDLKAQKKTEEQNGLLFFIEKNGYEINTVLKLLEQNIQK